MCIFMREVNGDVFEDFVQDFPTLQPFNGTNSRSVVVLDNSTSAKYFGVVRLRRRQCTEVLARKKKFAPSFLSCAVVPSCFALHCHRLLLSLSTVT